MFKKYFRYLSKCQEKRIIDITEQLYHNLKNKLKKEQQIN